MTYKEWITATTGHFKIETADVELILFNQKELIPDENAEADKKIAKTALCREFTNLIPLANISEGGYSISWNWDAIKLWYNQTCAELGLTPIGRAKIIDKSNVW
ncbi:MAG: hypothetical protein LBJ63_07855 [Prevotellaceae bacterium]|jgi:hypothetical protein|nr:hypothetical protein [Prevotellaceae bacterium]